MMFLGSVFKSYFLGEAEDRLLGDADRENTKRFGLLVKSLLKRPL